MGETRGFLKYARREPDYRPVAERVADYRAVERQWPEDELCRQAARCMDCGTPFCHGCGCPLANVIPEFNDLAYRRRWNDALTIMLATNPFPEFTGRVCPAPCESSCTLDINSDPVTIRQIELAIGEKGFELGIMGPRPPAGRLARRVAVVGSGPAGLAAADALNKFGCQVTVYETAPKPGGILRYGIPDFKLEKWVVDRRAALMAEEGVRFETGVEIGRDVSYRFLQGRFDAVLLTGGARKPRDLNIPGRPLQGIHMAMPYLVQQNKRGAGELIEGEEISARGKAVVVIGGGDTGADCVGTAWRQGARHVLQMEIMPKPPETRDPATPWPLWPIKLRESSSHKEGGERRWSVNALEFVGDASGAVRQLKCVDVRWEPDAAGRLAPVNVAGTEFTVDAELALLAMGFVGPGPNRLVEELGMLTDERGFIRRDGNGMTSVRGVFVAGDMTQGPSLVVRAMADGRRAALGIMTFLSSFT